MIEVTPVDAVGGRYRVKKDGVFRGTVQSIEIGGIPITHLQDRIVLDAEEFVIEDGVNLVV